MDTGLSASDVALLNSRNSNDWGTDSFLWIFALLILAGGGFGGLGFGNNGGQAFTDASMQRGFDNQAIMSKLADMGNGICDSAYALNNSILTEGRAMQTQLANCCCDTNRNIDAVRYDAAKNAGDIMATSTANTQKILDAISTNRIADMQNQINQLQLQSALCGVPKINPYGYGLCPQFCNPCCPTV